MGLFERNPGKVSPSIHPVMQGSLLAPFCVSALSGLNSWGWLRSFQRPSDGLGIATCCPQRSLGFTLGQLLEDLERAKRLCSQSKFKEPQLVLQCKPYQNQAPHGCFGKWGGPTHASVLYFACDSSRVKIASHAVYLLSKHVGSKSGSRFFFVYWFLGIFWFYVRRCCKNCKSHKDETNAEVAICLFGVFFGFAVMGHADCAIERTLSRMTQSRPVP